MDAMFDYSMIPEEEQLELLMRQDAPEQNSTYVGWFFEDSFEG